jgi:hypothetical protein
MRVVELSLLVMLMLAVAAIPEDIWEDGFVLSLCLNGLSKGVEGEGFASRNDRRLELTVDTVML